MSTLKRSHSEISSSQDSSSSSDSSDSSDSETEKPKKPVQSPIVKAASSSDKKTQSVEEKEPEATWESLGVESVLIESMKALNWTKPTPIQAASLPHALAGNDLIGLAETGSGKTGAFGIPLLQALMKDPAGHFGLILAPTRELAFQISEQLEALGQAIGVTCVVIIGGVDMISQQIALMKKPHIIIASPGRICDHLENTKGFHLRNLKFLIMDEADRLLNMDFERELDKILQVIPRERTTYLFSATMTSKVSKLQRASLHKPVKISVSRKYGTVDGLKQYYVFMPAKHKDCYLAFLSNLQQGASTICFVSTCDHAQRVSMLLRNLGFAAIPIHGKLSQAQRLGALNKFKAATHNILVATDVCARGLDIPAVDVVINYDVPTQSKDYIHRVGRTARAGRSGKAINLVTQYDVELFQRIEKLIEKKLELFPPMARPDEVLVMLDRVTEAQRLALGEMREQGNVNKGSYHSRKGKGGGDNKKHKKGKGHKKQRR